MREQEKLIIYVVVIFTGVASHDGNEEEIHDNITNS